ncbi:hypothetical protein HXX76_006873 [Chlamydomonas incerta]|uniref:AAA+ ATPase domain-containing protein n=1 Tax=Chlamydomonas incerta TaxID=51695 RepID=A0A835W039_CHLIN|nr:hypothetical protein HXX76_006873 [Chlamydomonas incerta]|eukprot:KAG2435672.1 hypothetical protein HXX76_006873 [Chlamydomonas incerta]
MTRSIRHIFLTGLPGSGKSTLCRKVVETTSGLDAQWQGFFTGEVREHGERIGFDVITIGTGPALKGPLARVRQEQEPRRSPSVGKYCVDVSSFEQLALPALRLPGGRPASARLVLIDEVGKMELLSQAFFPAVRAVLDAPNVVVLGTIPTTREGRVIPQVAEICARPDVEVLTVTRDNREALSGQVAARLQSLLQSTRSPPPPPPPQQQQQLRPPPPPAPGPPGFGSGPTGPSGSAGGDDGRRTGTVRTDTAAGDRSSTSAACGNSAAGAGQLGAGGARGWSACLGGRGGGTSPAGGGVQAIGSAAGRTGGWGKQLGSGAGSGVRFVGDSGSAAVRRIGGSRDGRGAF